MVERGEKGEERLQEPLDVNLVLTLGAGAIASSGDGKCLSCCTIRTIAAQEI